MNQHIPPAFERVLAWLGTRKSLGRIEKLPRRGHYLVVPARERQGEANGARPR